MQRLGFASIIALLAVVLPPLGGFVVLGFLGRIAAWFDSHGDLGIVLYMAGFALFTGLALLPTYSQSILGGWAFGVAWGFPAALIGFFGGSIIGYGIARPTASERVTRVIDEEPKWAAVRDALVPAAGGRAGGWLKTLGIVTLLRLPPNSPFAITNLLLASVRVPFWIFCVGTLIGMAPRTLAAVWLGHAVRGQVASIEEGIKAPIPWWLFATMIVVTLAVLTVIGVIANRAITRVTRPTTPP